METTLRDTLVGLLVLAGLAAIAYLSISLGGVSYRGQGGLLVVATFDEVGGLKPRAQVVVGGVKVGLVRSIELTPDFRARVVLDVDESLQIPTDSTAEILTQGLLGDQYVAIQPGAEEQMLGPGDEIQLTQGAFVLEKMIGKLVQNLGVD
jgi:phospholipid/cholesterol/gamma-HCH transport system substrate-binding protein